MSDLHKLSHNKIIPEIIKLPLFSLLNLYVEYRSVREGTSGIFIYRNNLAEKVFQKKSYFKTGETKSWEATITFPGGRQAYWLYAKGPDFIYTSPVFVSED